jgi:hypothetical protein
LKIRIKDGRVVDLLAARETIGHLFVAPGLGVPNVVREDMLIPILDALEATLSIPSKRYADGHDDAYAIAYNVALKDVHRAAGLIIEENGIDR